MKSFNVLKRIIAAVFVSVAVMTSCKKTEEPQLLPPSFELDREDGVYIVKVDREITITPVYSNVEGAKYAWAEIGGAVLSEEPAFTYSSSEAGDKYFSLTVTNKAGEAYKEFKISVVPLLVPVISLNVPEGGYVIAEGTELPLVPSVNPSEGVTFEWSLNGQKVADTKDYVFSTDEKGDYKLKFTATAEDGSASVEVPVKVVAPEDMPVKWTFDQSEYNMSSGRSIRIKMWDVEGAENYDFVWTVNGKEVKRGKETMYVFSEKTEGKYDVTVTAESESAKVSQGVTVNVCGPEGTYRRSYKGEAKCNKVYSYTPAPGQYINEIPVSGTVPSTAEEACTFAESRFESGNYLSLGGFGGYVVVGFDHSIENDGDYNIQVIGNSFKGSSEPGIVWVMQDENGDGLPNDTWYELKGSEYGKGGEIRDYSVTYFKPSAPAMPVQWTDSEGKTGEVDYLGQYHKQDYYYPNWIQTSSYTLRGTCLPSRTTQDESTGFWTNGEFEWGYADNFSSIDRLTDDDNYVATANANHFKISNAVTFDGKPANLQYVDFVMVVCGVNAKAGWLGEVSPEIFGIKDFNLFKNNTGSSEDFESGNGIW